MSRFVRFRLVMPALLVLALAALLASSALAAPKSRTQSDFLMIPAAAFSPGAPSFEVGNPGQFLYSYSNTGAFVAPVQLPTGAEITKMTAYYMNDVLVDELALVVTLAAKQVNNRVIYEDLGTLTIIGGADPNIKTGEVAVTSGNRFVDNENISYYVYVGIKPSPSAAIRLNAVRIDYNRP